MPTNLTSVPDHPAEILMRAPDSSGQASGIRAGVYLRLYEQTHDLTFAALHNEAALRVRQAYDHSMDCTVGQKVAALIDLRSAIGDLLGLDD